MVEGEGNKFPLFLAVGSVAAVAFGFALAPAARAIQSSRAEQARIRALEPETRRRYQQLLQNLASRGIRVFTDSTRRDPQEQAALLASGKTTTRNSWHLLGRSIDAYPYDPATKKPDMNGKNVELFRVMHQEAAALGFKNLAFNQDGSKRYIITKLGPVWDGGHLEFHGPYLTQSQAVAAEGHFA